MPSPLIKTGTFDTSIKAWLSAMDKAKRIQPGGRLLFINKRTGSAVPQQESPSSQNLPSGAAGEQPIRTDPVAELRSKGMVLGKRKAKRARR